MFSNISYNFLRNIFFIGHIFFIFSIFLLPFYRRKTTVFQLLVIVSWYFNNNNCLITQIEKKIFNKTIIEWLGLNKDKKTKYKVPFQHRLLLYLFFSYNLYKIIVPKIFLID